jgi:hypothetical protein
MDVPAPDAELPPQDVDDIVRRLVMRGLAAALA